MAEAATVHPMSNMPAPPSIGDLRRSYLEALPMPGVMFVASDAGLQLLAANDAYREFAGGAGLDADLTALYARVAEFLAGAEQSRRFNGFDRYPAMKMSRLVSLDDGFARCLVGFADHGGQDRNALHRDALTGLCDRVGFSAALETAIRSDEPARYAVLLVDLTRFSRVNESLGAAAGDELILIAAQRLLGAVRGGDLLARIGGDEFAVLIRHQKGAVEAAQVAQRLRAAIATPFRLTEVELHVDCAIGIALVDPLHATGEALVRNAQIALKRAKSSGRTEFYRSGQVNAARRKLSLEAELRTALARDQLRLHYQPLINLATGEVAGFEALARWHHPDRGIVQPTEFIPVAEESGLIVPLGRWALNEATAALARWDAKAGIAVPLRMSVNVSALQLARDDVAGAVRDALASGAIAGSRLTLELTESAIVGDPARATMVLEALKRLDAHIAMDDFGTGYSSLAHLQKLPIDVLKIDRSFVTPMLRDRDSVAIVRAVLGLAEALGMTTTAEGVESAELAQTLAALGCGCAQGYYYSRPLTEDAAFRYWRARA